MTSDAIIIKGLLNNVLEKNGYTLQDFECALENMQTEEGKTKLAEMLIKESADPLKAATTVGGAMMNTGVASARLLAVLADLAAKGAITVGAGGAAGLYGIDKQMSSEDKALGEIDEERARIDEARQQIEEELALQAEREQQKQKKPLLQEPPIIEPPQPSFI